MNAQGEDVVAGIRNARPLAELHGESPDAYGLLLDNMKRLEDHYRDLCDIEFTIERGKLWMLQTRVGKRTAEAAFRIAGQLIDEGVISEEEALTREESAPNRFPQRLIALPLGGSRRTRADRARRSACRP